MRQTGKNSILFFDVSKVEYLPLIRSVAASGFLPILNNTPLRRAADDVGLPLQKWESFKPGHTSAHVQKEIIRIAEGFAGALKRSDVRKAFKSPAGDFLPVTGGLFVEQFMNLIAGEINTIETLDALSQCRDLKLIVLGCDNSAMERALLLYAEKLNIPTLQLAHGIQGKPTQAGVVTRSRTASMHKLCANFAAVFGRQMREDLLEVGIAPERIFVTGCPFWDHLYTPESRVDSTQARKRLGLKPEKPVILICSSYADGSSLFFSDNSQTLFHHHQLVLERVNQIVPDAQVILRPHPHELLRATDSTTFAAAVDELYAEWVKERGFEQVRIMRDRKVEAIRAADLVITLGTSSLIAEAMILKRPVVMLPWVKYNYHFVGAEDGVLIVEDESRLPEILCDLFSRPQVRDDLIKRQQNALFKINHLNDGSATERVAELIVDLAKSSQNSAKAASPNLNAPLQELQNGNSGDSVGTSNGENGKLRILQIVHDFPPFSFSGTELYTLNLSEELQNLGHEVMVLHPVLFNDKEPYSFERAVYNGVNVVQFNVYEQNGPLRSDFYNTSYDEPFERFLSSHSFDLVHFQHLYGLSANWVSIAKSLRLPVFLKIDDMFFYCRQIHLTEKGKTYCSGPESIDKCLNCMNSKSNKSAEEAAQVYKYLTFRKEFLQNIFQQVDFVHSPSHFLKRTSIENGFNNSKFQVIPTGIKPFKVSKKKVVAGGAIRIAFLGNIDVRKGIQDFLAAIEICQKESGAGRLKTDLEFVIYGHHSNNDLYHEMLLRINKHKNVDYKGPFSSKERPQIFSEIDLLIMSSIGENYPFILREALFAKVPVVATEIAGVPEIVDDGENGFLYAPGDVEALTSIFLKLARNRSILEELDWEPNEVKLIAAEARELEREYSRVVLSSCS